MAFQPRYSREEVERLVGAGDLGIMEVYRLEHQHPLNQLTHMLGIPLITFSAAYPLYAWFAWGELAWLACIATGGTGWFLQFLGHWIEGNKPAFTADPRMFFMGPVFFLLKPYFWVYPKLTGRPFWTVDARQASETSANVQG